MYVCGYMHTYTNIYTYICLFNKYLPVDDKVTTVIKISGVTSLVILLGYWVCIVDPKPTVSCIFKHSAYVSFTYLLCYVAFFVVLRIKTCLFPMWPWIS